MPKQGLATTGPPRLQVLRLHRPGLGGAGTGLARDQAVAELLISLFFDMWPNGVPARELYAVAVTYGI